MISKILDAEITLKERILPVLNSEMDIKVEWEVVLKKNDENAEFEIQYLSVSGWFNWIDKTENYTKKNTIEFCTTKQWKLIPVTPIAIFTNSLVSVKIEPIMAEINFDKKEIKIQL